MMFIGGNNEMHWHWRILSASSHQHQEPGNALKYEN